jgi:hypothetical protein
MTSNSAKIRTVEGKSPAGVRGKAAEMLNFRRISLCESLLWSRIGYVGDPTH